MKILLIILLLSSSLFSSHLSKLYLFYEKQKYDKGCDYGLKYFRKNRNDEKYLTLYGLSCVETDNIDRISTVIPRLRKTEKSRENSSYFATILLQKQLLKQAILDEKYLSDLHLPQTNFIISKIFNMFVQKRFVLKNKIYKLEDREDKSIKYQLYIDKEHMIIDVYQSDKFTKRYRYE